MSELDIVIEKFKDIENKRMSYSEAGFCDFEVDLLVQPYMKDFWFDLKVFLNNLKSDKT